MFQLHTPRLILRDLRDDDLTLIWRMAGLRAITRYQSVLKHESREAAHQWLQTAIFHNNERLRHAFNLVIVESQQKQEMGWIGWGYSSNPTYGDYSFGYALLPEYWGNGYMTEALRAGLVFMFKTLGAQGVTDYCETTNLGSARVMEKQGMKPVARWSEAVNDGSSVDYIRYAIQRSEWLALNAEQSTSRSC